MAKRPYDATKEHAPFERKQGGKGHPNKNRFGEKHPVSGKEAK